MSMPLDVASVRVQLDSAAAERMARRVGEKVGRRFASGFNTSTSEALEDAFEDATRPLEQAGGQAGKKYGQRFAEQAGDAFDADFTDRIDTRRMKPAVRFDPDDDTHPFSAAGSRSAEAFNAAFESTSRTHRSRYRRYGEQAADEFTDAFGDEFDDAFGDEFDRRGRSRDDDFGREGTRSGRAYSDSFGDEFDRRGSVFSRLFSTLGSAARGFGSVLGSVASAGAGALGSLASAGLSLGQGFLMAAAQAVLLTPLIAAVAGAATFAAGAVAAGIGGLPVLLGGILVPIAAVALGFDGIKRAAATLAPEFQRLRDAASDTFARLLVPAVENLRGLFPLLQGGIVGVATSLSEFARVLTEDLASPDALLDIQDAFRGIVVMLDRVTPGIRTLIGEVLDVAGVGDLWAILGSTIGGVARVFGQFLDRIVESGALETGLNLLGGFLIQLTDLFGRLAEGALEFFNSAGPGMLGFFESLRQIVMSVDWAALGDIFGSLMERLGAALENIAPETWERLAEAIGRLSEKFVELIEEGRLESLINFFSKMIEIAPPLIDFVLLLVEALDWVIGRFSLFGSALQEGGVPEQLVLIGQSFWELGRLIKEAVTDFMAWLGIASPSQKFIDIGLAIVDGIRIGLTGGPQAVWEKITEMRQRILDALADAPTLLLGKGREVVDGAVQGIGERLDAVRSKAGEIKDRVLDALADAGEWLVGLGGDLVDGFISGIGSKIGAAASKAAEMATAAYNAARNAIRSDSPSKLFADLGRNTGEGFILGIQALLPRVVATVQTMFDRVTESAQSGVDRLDLGALVPDSLLTDPASLFRGVGAALRDTQAQAVRASLGSGQVAGLTAADVQAAFEAALSRARWVARGEDLEMVVSQAAAWRAQR